MHIDIAFTLTGLHIDLLMYESECDNVEWCPFIIERVKLGNVLHGGGNFVLELIPH